ncbi:MAG: hypothetical protein FWE67_04995 [Planctomycetaceae bacterium]|nr:hypothetical protein [Planctomycetaceae bacterium]
MNRFVFSQVLRLFCFTAVFLLAAVKLAASPPIYLLDIPLPIVNDNILRSLENTVQEIGTQTGKQTDSDAENKPVIVLRLRTGINQETFGRGSSFGDCYELARYLNSEKLNGIRTVAFFPQTVKGHAVLPALACGERLISENAEFGEAAVDETNITETLRNAYREIAAKRNVIPQAVADKILDPQTVLMQVQTEKGTRIISPEELPKIRQTETLSDEPETLIPAGQPGLFSATTARKINLADRIVEDNTGLASYLNCRPNAIKFAPLLRRSGSAARVNINGVINNDNAASTIRKFQNLLEPPQNITAGQLPAAKIDFLVICIDSPGGNLEASLNIASYIVHNIDSSKVRVVAYIPYQARSDSALIAAACDEIVLGNNAVLGGDGAVVFSKKRIDDAHRIVRESLAKESLRNWSMPAAFFDPDIEINKYIREGKVTLADFFCEEELEQQPDKQQWKKEQTVKNAGKLLEIIGGKDIFSFTDKTVKDFNEFKQAYRLQDEPRLAEPGWAEKLLWTLRSPGMSAIILTIIILAVILELNTPGIGIGTFIAIMGTVVFFWIHFLDGSATTLELLLFLAGAGCVLIEIFLLPGLGIFGIGGALAMICAFILASQTFIIPQNSYQYAQTKNSLTVLVICGTGSLFIGAAISKRVNKITKPKDTELIYETEKLADYSYLLGKSGKTLTPLVPAGKAVFDEKPVDVVSDGGIIEKDKNVEVIEVIGYRVVVRQTQV